MRNKNLPSRAWKHMQRSTPSNESLDCFAAVVSMWWALRRAERGERRMIEACERVVPVDAASRTGEKSSTDQARFGEIGGASTPNASSAQRQADDGDGLFKYVVLYALTLVLQPVLAVVLTAATLWGLWQVLLWVFLS